jgi:hypothetical protein
VFELLAEVAHRVGHLGEVARWALKIISSVLST